jgi:hypothetical protein
MLGGVAWLEGAPIIDKEIEALNAMHPTLYSFTSAFSLFSVALLGGIWTHNRRSVVRSALVAGTGEVGGLEATLAFDAMTLTSTQTHEVPLHRLVKQPPVEPIPGRSGPGFPALFPLEVMDDTTYYMDLRKGKVHNVGALAALGRGHKA